MRMRVLLHRAGTTEVEAVVLDADATTSVGDLATVVRRRDPRGSSAGDIGGAVTLAVGDGAARQVLDASLPLGDAPVASGASVAVVPAPQQFGGAAGPPAEATVTIVAGPDTGRQFPIPRGATVVGRGRDCDVRLSDPLVSKRHARINVGELVEVHDLGSANGVIIGDARADRSLLRPSDVVVLGDTSFRVTHHPIRDGAPRGSAVVQFNRPPVLRPIYPGAVVPAPRPPEKPGRARLPIVALIAPVVMGGILFYISKQVTSLIFIALSPIMLIGTAVEGRFFGARDFKAGVKDFRAALDDMVETVITEQVVEVHERATEHPPVGELVSAAKLRGELLWAFRPERPGFLEVRLGLGRAASRVQIEPPQHNEAPQYLYRELADRMRPLRLVEPVPIVAALPSCGSLGVAGPRAAAGPVLRSIVTQLVLRHSPAELVLAAVTSSTSVTSWSWLSWLPHTSGAGSPLEVPHLASGAASIGRLVAALEELVEIRAKARRGTDSAPVPAVVVVVEDDVPGHRPRLVALAARGGPLGVHLLWSAATYMDLPAGCTLYVDVAPHADGSGALARVVEADRVQPLVLDRLADVDVELSSRDLAPVVDAGVSLDAASEIPRSVNLVDLLGRDVLGAPGETVTGGEAVLDRWRLTNSLPQTEGSPRRKGPNHLRASIGAAAGASFVLDLREHGPHALVGGTTGAGKSEFLQSWVMGMAVEHSPARVTFLFVDYKGGAAFGECVQLPHSVGMVTDLSPALVRRALTSLNAELRHREHVLNDKKAKDLLELERRGDPDAPPALVIIVDEFAALATEVPEFVDGVVNVAQRGRSLGLHLILATQRPAGVIKDNLRANTNLRVALRMADEADSTDVIGLPIAAGFDPSLPGRGVAKLGPGRPTQFQSGYVGGWTSDVPPPPRMSVLGSGFGTLTEWDDPPGTILPAPPQTGPNDLVRLVRNVNAAFESSGLQLPRKPWLDTLAEVYDLAKIPQSRTDTELVVGVTDIPDEQRQGTVSFRPDVDGNMAVYGTGGSGKTTVLRTIAIVAGLGLRGGPCHVYGLDFGARGLQVLEVLPHVGSMISGDDNERVVRLLTMLRSAIDERAVKYAKVNAGTIADYRVRASAPDEPRLLLLVDGVGAFRTAYEAPGRWKWWDVFQAICADGRQVGVHVVVTADRPGAVPTALNAVIQRRLGLRMSNNDDYSALGVKPDVFGEAPPPGRGFLDGLETQVAVLSGTSDTSAQALAIGQLADGLTRTSGRSPAPPIESLTERVTLAELPKLVGDLPALGIGDSTLAPVGFSPVGSILISGPPHSGRTSVLASLLLSVQRARPGRFFVHLGVARSPLLTTVPWQRTALGADDVATAAAELTADIASGAVDGACVVVVIENIAEFLNNFMADEALQTLVKAVRAAEGLVLADGDVSSLNQSWPLLQLVKTIRHGIALQPDDGDGDSIFKTTFDRMNRAEFPPGRGVYVRSGRYQRVQFALPEE